MSIEVRKELPPNVRDAIEQFHAAIAALKKLRVIRSDKYLGDIAEYLCSKHFDMVLSGDQRQEGWDAVKDGVRFQIKYNGAKTTNINIGNPEKYDFVIIVLGPESCLRPKDAGQNTFLIYDPISAANCQRSPNGENYYIAKKQLLKVIYVEY